MTDTDEFAELRKVVETAERVEAARDWRQTNEAVEALASAAPLRLSPVGIGATAFLLTRFAPVFAKLDAYEAVVRLIVRRALAPSVRGDAVRPEGRRGVDQDEAGRRR